LKYDVAEQKLSSLNAAFPDALKRSILQAAVQGKLVEQDPADEPASVLLERIRAEKAALVKAGKAKKDKHESIIFRRDNSHYEKLDGIERCIDDEIPFDVPETWAWVRLESIVYNHGQMTPQESFCYIDIGSIDNKRQSLNEQETVLIAAKAPSRARKIVRRGDILYSTVRPYLHNMCIIDRQFSHIPIASTGFALMACYHGLHNRYLFSYLLSPDFDSYANNIENSKGVAYPAINDTRLYNALVPLPPLSEQERITAKIEELFDIAERL
jgi:type I restriction enzyme S subunit